MSNNLHWQTMQRPWSPAWEEKSHIQMSLSSRNNPTGMSNNELLVVFPTTRRFRKPLYELALLDLTFTPAKENTVRSEPAHAVTFESDNFRGVQHIKFQKDTSDLMSFFSTFSKLVVPHGIKPIASTIQSGSDVDLFIQIQSEIEDLNTYIMFPLSLANLFKLPARQIWKGTLLASEICSQVDFNEIAMGTEFDVQIVTSESAENRIICEEEVEQMFFMRAPSTKNKTDFFTQISNQFYRLNYSVIFDFSDPNNSKVSVYSLRRTPNDLVIIPQALADALGLETRRLYSGVHESHQPFQTDKFELIEEGERLWFTFHRYYTTIYSMVEPKTKDYEKMIRAINVSMNENYLPYLRIKFSYEGDGLRLSDGPDTIKVTLPKAVNEFYKFPADTVFYLRTWMQLPKEIRDQMNRDEIEKEERELVNAVCYILA